MVLLFAHCARVVPAGESCCNYPAKEPGPNLQQPHRSAPSSAEGALGGASSAASIFYSSQQLLLWLCLVHRLHSEFDCKGRFFGALDASQPENRPFPSTKHSSIFCLLCKTLDTVWREVRVCLGLGFSDVHRQSGSLLATTLALL